MYPANGFAIAIIPQAYQRIFAKQIYAIAQPLYFTTPSSTAGPTLVRTLETLYTINSPQTGRLF
jgi:hypothetical protein